MQVICNTEDFQITEKTAVTLGKFDGIHKGHQLLLNALLEKKKQGLKTVVFTFFVPPIPGREDVRQLTPNDEKKKFLEAYGIDYLIEYPFTEKVRHTAPKDFIQEILCKKLCAAFVAAGPDFCFGYERNAVMNLKCLIKFLIKKNQSAAAGFVNASVRDRWRRHAKCLVVRFHLPVQLFTEKQLVIL